MKKNAGWLYWLMPRPFDWVTTIFYLAALAVHFYFRFGVICNSCYFGPLGAWLITLAIVTVLVLDRFEYWRYGEVPSRSIATIFLVVRTALVVLISTIDEYNFSMFLYILLPFTAFPIFGSWASYGLALFAWLAYLLKITSYPNWTQDQHEIVFFIVYTAGVVFMVTMAHVVNQEKASRTQAETLLRDLEASHEQLRAYAAQAAEAAATEERNRLARDIHDSLGHYLTVINVQLEKALAFRSRQPTAADQAIADAKRLASEALQDIRRSVGALRERERGFVLVPALQKLVQDVEHEGLVVALQVTGREDGYSYQSLVTLYRAAQEGLTNVQKHAQAGRAMLDLCFNDHQATLELADDGRGFIFSADGLLQHGSTGYGLQGLHERLELIHGVLQLENRNGHGACLRATVPKDLLV